jgi:hypothetical protein
LSLAPPHVTDKSHPSLSFDDVPGGILSDASLGVRRLLGRLVALAAAPAVAQSQAELEYLQRRVDEIRDPRFRRMAQDELIGAQAALRQNNAEEFRARSEAVARLARFDEFQYRR